MADKNLESRSFWIQLESPDKKIPDFDNFSKGFFEIIKNCKKLLSLTVNINKRRNPPNASPSLRDVEFFPVRKDERDRGRSVRWISTLVFVYISNDQYKINEASVCMNSKNWSASHIQVEHSQIIMRLYLYVHELSKDISNPLMNI